MGLDHIVARGVGNRLRTPQGIIVTDYDRCEQVLWPSWDMYREYRMVCAKFGREVADKKFGFHTVSSGAQEITTQLTTPEDFRALREIAIASRFDTITPEDIINGH